MAVRTTPPPIPKENHSHVVQVAVGKEHGLLLTDEGAVYSWGGRNDHGQLGRATWLEASMQEPAPIIERLKSEVIVQIACGAEHCLALSQKGVLFAWGYNKAGQLGIGLAAHSKGKELNVRLPTPVTFEDGSVVVKSCSCAPESSACVTSRGEIYIWGAMSYFFFSSGARYNSSENCTKPVKLRGCPPEVCLNYMECAYCPDQVAICREQIACTIAPQQLESDLGSYIASLKGRSSDLLAKTRGNRSRKSGPRGAANDAFQGEDVKALSEEFRQQSAELDKRVQELENLRTACQGHLMRIGRELMVCEQQDTALTETAANLERDVDGGHGQMTRTQLNDINHFRSSNKRGKLQLLEQRDEKERENLNLTQEYTDAVQRKSQVEALSNLIAALQRGELTSRNGSSSDEGLKIADSKRMELAATDPQVLAGVGRFTGFKEVLSISDRALQDVSSALREVSATATSGDGALLEEVLEANLKLRKEINTHIQAKLHQAEGRGNSQAAKEHGGMSQFFLEAQVPGAQKFGGLQPRDQAPSDAPAITAGGWGNWKS